VLKALMGRMSLYELKIAQDAGLPASREPPAAGEALRFLPWKRQCCLVRIGQATGEQDRTRVPAFSELAGCPREIHGLVARAAEPGFRDRRRFGHERGLARSDGTRI